MEGIMQLAQQIKMRQSQSLVMTPQLQQAIKLLQMTNIELCQYLENQQSENPFLEIETNIDSKSYDDQENIVYGIMEKFYTRIRPLKNSIPKDIKPKGIPSLRKLDKEYMTEDSDLHLSDYESFIYNPLNKILKKM